MRQNPIKLPSELVDKIKEFKGGNKYGEIVLKIVSGEIIKVNSTTMVEVKKEKVFEVSQPNHPEWESKIDKSKTGD